MQSVLYERSRSLLLTYSGLKQLLWEIYTGEFHSYLLDGIKVRVFFEKNIEENHLSRHNKNCYYFCKSNIPVINLILGSRNMIKISKNMILQEIR